MSIKGFIVSMLYDKELGEINRLTTELMEKVDKLMEANRKWQDTCEAQKVQIGLLEQYAINCDRKVEFYKSLALKLADAIGERLPSPIANGLDVEYPTPVQSENETLSVTKESIDADSNSNS